LLTFNSQYWQSLIIVRLLNSISKEYSTVWSCPYYCHQSLNHHSPTHSPPMAFSSLWSLGVNLPAWDWKVVWKFWSPSWCLMPLLTPLRFLSSLSIYPSAMPICKWKLASLHWSDCDWALIVTPTVALTTARSEKWILFTGCLQECLRVCRVYT